MKKLLINLLAVAAIVVAAYGMYCASLRTACENEMAEDSLVNVVDTVIVNDTVSVDTISL